MFDDARETGRKSIDSYEPRQVDYFEGWACSKGDKNPNSRTGTLKPQQIQPWLKQDGEFAPLPAVDRKIQLRLIACDRISLHPPKIGMTEATLDVLEEELYLHPATMQTLLPATGTFSKHTERDQDDPTKVRRIQILLKVPQKYEIANYGLSISFDVRSRVTTAFLFGESVTNFVYDKHRASGHPSESASPFTRLVEYLKHSCFPWDHPLLVPSALMTDHFSRTRVYCEASLAKKVYQMEREIDVTQVGLRNDFGEEGLSPDFRAQDLPFNPEPLFDRDRASNLTVRLNTLYTRVLFTQGSPTWNKEAALFLIRIQDEILSSLRQEKTNDDHIFFETMEYQANVATALESVVSSFQSRMELQLNILYSFVSQTDNRINERIALSSGRDSTSMKILALISAFFLPGTFVATLFSMSMFQWQAGGDTNQNGGVVNDKFWIYWAVAVPLTIATVLGWGFWWRFELQAYDKLMNSHKATPDISYSVEGDKSHTKKLQSTIFRRKSRRGEELMKAEELA